MTINLKYACSVSTFSVTVLTMYKFSLGLGVVGWTDIKLFSELPDSFRPTSLQDDIPTN